MELLSTIAEKVLEYTVVSVGRQLGYLIFCHKNVNRLKDEFQELQNEREAVEHSIDAARRNGEKIEVKVRDWFTKVDEITERGKKLYEEESHAKTRCSYKSCPNLWLRHQLGRESKKMTLEVVKIKGEGKFDRVSFNEPPQSIYLSSTGIEGIESRVSTMHDVLKALGDSNVNMIGLCGLPGVGKTTLANEVAKRVKKEKLFEMVVIVTVAQHPVLKEIQRQIAENVGMKFDVETERVRASRLRERLKKEKKLLVVLDDLWERLDLDEVGIPFDFEGNKKTLVDVESDKRYTKILLTSRNKDLLSNQMRCERFIMVGILSEKEAWELFKEKAELHDDSNDIDLLDVEHEVAKQCCQLPLAIVAVARAMRGKSPSEWRDALQQLKNPLRRNITGINIVDSSLRLSYDYLNSQELRSIFLLSAMLSHDSLVIDLIMYSVGLSLLPYVHSMEEARDRVDALVDKLKALNLLIDSFSSYYFTMHDVVRYFALSIASKEQDAIVVKHEKKYELLEKNVLEGCTRLCLDTYDRLPKELYCPRLEFFLLDNKNPDLKISSMFFKSMQELRVMNFTNIHFSSLPSSLGLLEKVKTLCLHSCTLEDIAEVGKLKNLKVLSLANSVITRLPSELGGLNSLQMLNLAHCSKLEVIPPKLLSSLKRLEVLNMEKSFNKWEAEGSSKGNDNASLVELMYLSNLSSLDIHILDASVLPKDLFSKNLLKRYRIFIGQDWEWSGQYETSKTLKLKLESSIHLEHGVRKLLERVEELYLDELYEIDNVIYDLDGRGFQHLKHLWIQNNSQIEYIINSTGLVDVFPNLETLDLSNLNGLKKLCGGQITAKSFQKLRVIKVSGCNQLEVLFSTSMVELFGSLVEIDIRECESIKEIVVSTDKNMFQQNFTTGVVIFHQLRSLKMDKLPTLTDFFFDDNATNNGDNNIFKSFFTSKVIFPKLEILEIDSMNIRRIWSDQLPHSFSNLNLRVIKVSRCNQLEVLFSTSMVELFGSLVEMEICECESIKEIVVSAEYMFQLQFIGVIIFHQLRSLKMDKLPTVTDFFFDNATNNGDNDIFKSFFSNKVSFPNLEILKIFSLNIQYIWSDQLPRKSFNKLKALHVEACDFLVKLIPLHIVNCLSNLEEVEVRGCRSLEMVFDFEELKNTDKKIHSLLVVPLKRLLLLDLPKLKHVWSTDSQVLFPNLEILKIFSLNIQYIWSDQLSHNSFNKLKALHVEACDFLVKLIPLHIVNCLRNLEEVEVRGCRSLEMVFDFEELKNTNKEIHSSLVVPLRKLLLLDLPKLKHVWSSDSKGGKNK